MAYQQTCVDTGKSCNFLVQRSSCIDCGKVATSHFHTASKNICLCFSDSKDVLGYDKLPFVQGLIDFLGLGALKEVHDQEPPLTCDVIPTNEHQDELLEDADEVMPLPSISSVASSETNTQDEEGNSKRKSRKRRRSSSSDSGHRKNSSGKGTPTLMQRPRKRSASPTSTPSAKIKQVSTAIPNTSNTSQQPVPTTTRRPLVSPVYSSARYLQRYQPTIHLEEKPAPTTASVSQKTSDKRLDKKATSSTLCVHFVDDGGEEQEVVQSRSSSCPALIGGHSESQILNTEEETPAPVPS